MPLLRDEVVYFACAAEKSESAQAIDGQCDRRDRGALGRIADRLARIYEVIVAGEIASHGVTFPNVYEDGLNSAIYTISNDAAYLGTSDFQVCFSETCAEFHEDKLSIGFQGNPKSIRKWAAGVENQYFPKGKYLPKVFWPNDPNPKWETMVLTNQREMVDLEHAALDSSVFPWGYRTIVEDSEIVSREYYFRDVGDAFYARLMS